MLRKLRVSKMAKIACVMNEECLQRGCARVQIMSCAARHWNRHVAATGDFFPLSRVAANGADDSPKVKIA